MRLNQGKRDAILKEEANKKFYDAKAAIKQKINEEVQKLIKKTVPDWITDEMIDSGYIPTTMSFSIEGYYRSDLRDIKISQPYPYLQHGHQNIISPSKTLEKLIKKKEEIYSKEHQFCRDVRLILNSYTSVKSLLKAVPEFSIYFENEVKATALVPVEQIEKVRKMLVRDE